MSTAHDILPQGYEHEEEAVDEDVAEAPDWIAFDGIAEGAMALIGRLPDGFMKDQCRAKIAELCYWFNEAHIEAQERYATTGKSA